MEEKVRQLSKFLLFETSARFRSRILIGFILIVVAIEFFGRSNLVDRMPAIFTIIGAAFGLSLGCWVVAAISRQNLEDRTLKEKFGLLAMPIFCLFAGAYAARSAFLTAAFLGVPTTPHEVKVALVDRSSRPRRLWGNHHAEVVLENDSREFRVLVSEELYELIGPKPRFAKHCLKVRSETGRWGYRRILAPNYFDEPFGLDDYTSC